jgi:predicted transcriptional regulator
MEILYQRGKASASEVLAAMADAPSNSAIRTLLGILEAKGRTNLHALPRIVWDGRLRSLRAMRAILSGVAFPAEKRARGARA